MSGEYVHIYTIGQRPSLPSTPWQHATLWRKPARRGSIDLDPAHIAGSAIRA
jgi:hypothetical protein